jgi:hypothetical protein
MAHLTIHLTDDVEKRVLKETKAAKVSVSKWIADRVRKSVEGTFRSKISARRRLELESGFAQIQQVALDSAAAMASAILRMEVERQGLQSGRSIS